MPQTKEPSGKKIIHIVMGTRLDHVPAPETQQFVSNQCMECHMETATEIEYPEGTAIVCNVCVPVVHERVARENNAVKAFAMTPEAKVRMIEMAQRRGVPVEALIKGFYAWKTGALPDTQVTNLPVKKKHKK